MRYLAAVRTLVNNDTARRESSSSVGQGDLDDEEASTKKKTRSKRLSPRDVLFAYHSNDQRVLLDETIEAVGRGGKLSWDDAKSFGIPLWLRDQDSFVSFS